MSRQDRKANRMVTTYTPSVQDSRVFKQRLTYTTTLSTSVAGIINFVFPTNPSVSAEWSTYAALYDDFRVVGMRLRLVSKQQFSVTALNDSFVVAYDNNNVTPLTGLDAGLQYDTSHLLPAIWAHSPSGQLNQEACPTFVFMRPSQGKNTAIEWIDTAVPTNSLGGIKTYGTLLTASTAYMVASIDWYVEFRGRS